MFFFLSFLRAHDFDMRLLKCAWQIISLVCFGSFVLNIGSSMSGKDLCGLVVSACACAWYRSL
jgi:hypothetical protein